MPDYIDPVWGLPVVAVLFLILFALQVRELRLRRKAEERRELERMKAYAIQDLNLTLDAVKTPQKIYDQEADK